MAAADISGQNRKKRDVGNDSRGEAVVAAAPSAKKAKRSGPESSRKQKRRTIPKIQLDESRERAEMASAERDCLRFENQLLNESQSAKGEALLGLSHSFTPHVCMFGSTQENAFLHRDSAGSPQQAVPAVLSTFHRWMESGITKSWNGAVFIVSQLHQQAHREVPGRTCSCEEAFLNLQPPLRRSEVGARLEMGSEGMFCIWVPSGVRRQAICRSGQADLFAGPKWFIDLGRLESQLDTTPQTCPNRRCLLGTEPERSHLPRHCVLQRSSCWPCAQNWHCVPLRHHWPYLLSCLCAASWGEEKAWVTGGLQDYLVLVRLWTSLPVRWPVELSGHGVGQAWEPGRFACDLQYFGEKKWQGSMRLVVHLFYMGSQSSHGAGCITGIFRRPPSTNWCRTRYGQWPAQPRWHALSDLEMGSGSQADPCLERWSRWISNQEELLYSHAARRTKDKALCEISRRTLLWLWQDQSCYVFFAGWLEKLLLQTLCGAAATTCRRDGKEVSQKTVAEIRWSSKSLICHHTNLRWQQRRKCPTSSGRSPAMRQIWPVKAKRYRQRKVVRSSDTSSNSTESDSSSSSDSSHARKALRSGFVADPGISPR